MDSGIGLANLLRWSLQVALLACVGAAIIRLLGVHAPVIRHAFWRTLLVICLMLPTLQPWTPMVSSAARLTDVGAAPNVGTSIAEPSSGARPSSSAIATRFMRANWAVLVVLTIAAGAAARGAWIVGGLVRLRRLRRRSRPAIADSDYDDLASLIEAGARIEYAAGLGQPVTYGLFRPVVLLPDRFPSLPSPVRRAVLAHELWHVRRRDWAFVLLEEMVRALFWFNPAVWWLVTQVQTSREEVVDELTVQLTNSRRTYLEALLVFADQPTMFPATPFARRRHLFHRMLLISREAVMSSRKIVMSSIVAGVAVTVTAWAAVSAFPLVASAAPEPAAQSQNPPRDRRPGEAGPESAMEVQLKDQIRADSTKSDPYFALAGLQEQRGARNEAEATLDAVYRAFPTDGPVLARLAKVHLAAGRFDQAVAMLEARAALDPANPQVHQMVAVFYWEKAFKDKNADACAGIRLRQVGNRRD